MGYKSATSSGFLEGGREGPTVRGAAVATMIFAGGEEGSSEADGERLRFWR